MTAALDQERAFYRQRTRAFSGAHLSQQDIAPLFPERKDIASCPVVFCPDRQYAANLLKMGWLLGRSIYAVTPYFAFQYSHTDVTRSRTYPEITSLDPDLLRWRDNLRQELEEDRIKLLPAAMVRLSKISDSYENWENIGITVSVSNLDHELTAAIDGSNVDTIASVSIDLPKLIIADVEVLRRVQDDYPVASLELKTMLSKLNEAARGSSPEVTETDTLNRILEEVIIPHVNAIRKEHRRILQSNAISTAIEVAGATIPLAIAFATSTNELVTKLLASGLGLLVAKGLNQTRKDLSESRKSPFFAALQMKVG